MASLVLSTAGGAVGGALFGTVGAMAGRLAGAVAGSLIDQSLFGSSGTQQTREGPRLRDLDVMVSTEGAPIPRVYGRARITGEVIWATALQEAIETHKETTGGGGGGKGGGGGGGASQPVTTKTTTYSYYANIAVGLCEGPIGHVARVFADGKLIFFCPDVNNQRGRHDYNLAPSELEWLSGALQSPLPTMIFSHVPLLAGPLFGNYYFEGKRGRAEFLNAADARTMISDSNAILSLSGHVHWNTWHCVDGIHYVTLQSLTESFTTHPLPAGAYTVLEIGEDISIDVGGLDRMQLSLRPRRSQRQWLKR
jgi:hypothetical protein